MADEKNLENAKKVYGTLCQALDNREWRYDKDEENLVVYFGVNGDDIPMNFVIIVDANRQIVRLASMLPFKMSEGKRMEGAIATCAATYGLADGSFDYDLSDGSIVFRLTASFRGSELGEPLFQYMISCASAMVDHFNDQFLAIDKGVLSIGDFLSNRQ